jgi:glycosyltransferase involved in cell wall biosynthesis
MSDRYQVSVVMPAYNVAPFIATSVESVLQQSFTDLELIVVDDGSVDGTADRLSGFRDPRLRVIRQANSGSAAARNSGILLASGQYMGFLDADDLWAPTKLETHIGFLERHPDVDLTFSRSEIIDENGDSTGRTSYPASGEVSFQKLLTENVVNNGSAVVMRRGALDQAGYFDADLNACVDLDLWLRVALLRPRNIYCLDELLTKYRMRSGQVTKDWRRMETAWMKMFAKVGHAAGTQVKPVADKSYAKFSRYLSYIAYENHDYANSAKLLLRALRLSPLPILADRRTWVLTSALAARAVLPARIHHDCDAFVRRLRSRRYIGARGPELKTRTEQ